MKHHLVLLLISLATKYYDEIDAGIGIDEDAVTKDIHPEDYKEYAIASNKELNLLSPSIKFCSCT